MPFKLQHQNVYHGSFAIKLTEDKVNVLHTDSVNELPYIGLTHTYTYTQIFMYMYIHDFII